MKIDFKIVTIVAIMLFIAAVFYYTTKTRLDDADRELLFLNRQLHDLKQQDKRLNRLIRRHKKEHHLLP